MKWWGWLVIAIGGSIMWSGLVAILEAIFVPIADRSLWRHYTSSEEAVVGGVITICSGCVIIPLVQKAIKAAKENE